MTRYIALLGATPNKSNRFDDHLVVILQLPIVDKSLIMNIYKVYNLPILHPVLQKTF